jgi:hypothetical protein
MGFVRRADIERHRAGCFEARVAAVAAAVREHLGAGATVLATHADHAVVRVGDAVKRVAYGLDEASGAVAHVVVEDADVPVLAGYALDCAVQGELREAVATLVAGGAVDRTRVRDLARMARRDGTYWIEEAAAACEPASAPWWGWYEPQAALVRERLHGRIREIEAAVPSQRYAKLGEGRLPEYAAELRASVGQLRAVAGGLFDGLAADVTYQGEGLAAVHQSLRDEAGTLSTGLAWLESMVWAGKEGVVAATHDRIAARLRDALVVHAHLGTQRSTGHGA